MIGLADINISFCLFCANNFAFYNHAIAFLASHQGPFGYTHDQGVNG